MRVSAYGASSPRGHALWATLVPGDPSPQPVFALPLTLPLPVSNSPVSGSLPPRLPTRIVAPSRSPRHRHSRRSRASSVGRARGRPGGGSFVGSSSPSPASPPNRTRGPRTETPRVPLADCGRDRRPKLTPRTSRGLVAIFRPASVGGARARGVSGPLRRRMIDSGGLRAARRNAFYGKLNLPNSRECSEKAGPPYPSPSFAVKVATRCLDARKLNGGGARPERAEFVLDSRESMVFASFGDAQKRLDAGFVARKYRLSDLRRGRRVRVASPSRSVAVDHASGHVSGDDGSELAPSPLPSFRLPNMTRWLDSEPGPRRGVSRARWHARVAVAVRNTAA